MCVQTILGKYAWLDHMGLAVCLLEIACAHACHCFSICGKTMVLCVLMSLLIQCVTVYESQWEGAWLHLTGLCFSSFQGILVQVSIWVHPPQERLALNLCSHQDC